MPFKFNTDGSVAMKGKLPVFVDAKGNESAFDPDANVARVEALSKRVIRAAFDSSPFVKTLKMPPDIVASLFAERYSLGDDGAIVATNADGNVVRSRKTFIDPAEFDDSLEQLVTGSKFQGFLTQGPANGGSAGSLGGSKVITRSQLDALNPKARAEHFQNGGRVVDDDRGAQPAQPPKPAPEPPAPGSRITRVQFDALPPGMRAKAVTTDRCVIVD